MLATPGRLPEGAPWRFEVRWPGLRVLAEITGGAVRLATRDGRDVTDWFPELAELGGLVADAVLDGQLIVLDRGLPSPVALGPDRRRQDGSAVLMAFDVLRLYGIPLLHRPLDDRRATLERIAAGAPGCLALSPVYCDGRALLAATRARRLHGVVAKRGDGPYRPGVRDPSWVEVLHGGR